MKKIVEGTKYPNEFKREIAESYLFGNCSYEEIVEKHELHNKQVAKDIIKWYKKDRPLLGKEQQKITAMMSKQEREIEKREASESEEMLQLREELRLAQLKIVGLETLINIAETELKIPIRKKCGAKQPKK